MLFAAGSDGSGRDGAGLESQCWMGRFLDVLTGSQSKGMWQVKGLLCAQNSVVTGRHKYVSHLILADV